MKTKKVNDSPSLLHEELPVSLTWVGKHYLLWIYKLLAAKV